VIAVGVLAFRALRRALGGQYLVSSATTAEEIAARESIPYAPAIALGVWLSLVPKG
jgi:Flp pilus assembly protein protease CpaA